MKVGFPALILPLVLTACSSGFAKYYQDGLGGKAVDEIPYLIRHTGEPNVTYSRNKDEDHVRLMENGFVQIGHSSFNGPDADLDGARKQARRVGAAIVLVTQNYRNTASGSIPVSTFGSVTYYPYNVDRYDHLATYWVKRQPGIIGVFIRDLSPDMKKAVERNKGVEVIVTVKGLPAFQAEIIRGDVIVSIRGKEVVDRQSFLSLIEEHAGTEVEIGILREKKEITKRVPLNQRP